MANAKTTKRKAAPGRVRRARTTTGRIRAPRMTSARMAEIREHVETVRESLEAAIARGEKLRNAIEKRIDRELKDVTPKGGKVRRRRAKA